MMLHFHIWSPWFSKICKFCTLSGLERGRLALAKCCISLFTYNEKSEPRPQSTTRLDRYDPLTRRGYLSSDACTNGRHFELRSYGAVTKQTERIRRMTGDEATFPILPRCNEAAHLWKLSWWAFELRDFEKCHLICSLWRSEQQCIQ